MSCVAYINFSWLPVDTVIAIGSVFPTHNATMMILACLFPLLACVAAWPRYPSPLEQTLEQRSGSELVQLFSHLGDETVAAAIAKEIESLNIDPTIPFSRIHPETAWVAVQKMVSIMVPALVPESRGETFAWQAFLGFGRHYWHELLEKEATGS